MTTTTTTTTMTSHTPLFKRGTVAWGSRIDGGGADLLTGLERDRVSEQLMRHGAILLRDFVHDIPRLRSFTELFGSGFAGVHEPERDLHPEDSTFRTTGYGTGYTGLHSEGSFLPGDGAPRLLWFSCERPPEQAGETLLCDGCALWEALPHAVRDVLEEHPLLYQIPVSEGSWMQFLGVTEVEDAQAALAAILPEGAANWNVPGAAPGEVYIRSVKSAVACAPYGARKAFLNHVLNLFHDPAIKGRSLLSFENGWPVPHHLVQQVQTAADTVTLAHAWKAGDVLMLDNRRMLHGRNAYAPDSRRRILLRMASEVTFEANHAPIDRALNPELVQP